MIYTIFEDILNNGDELDDGAGEEGDCGLHEDVEPLVAQGAHRLLHRRGVAVGGAAVVDRTLHDNALELVEGHEAFICSVVVRVCHQSTEQTRQ